MKQFATGALPPSRAASPWRRWRLSCRTTFRPARDSAKVSAVTQWTAEQRRSTGPLVPRGVEHRRVERVLGARARDPAREPGRPTHQLQMTLAVGPHRLLAQPSAYLVDGHDGMGALVGVRADHDHEWSLLTSVSGRASWPPRGGHAS